MKTKCLIHVSNVPLPVLAVALSALLLSGPLPRAFASGGSSQLDNGTDHGVSEAKSDSDGFHLAFNLFFGSESDRSDISQCRNVDVDGPGSVLGSVNAFFCHLEKDFGIDKAPTAASSISVTKTFKERVAHVEFSGEAGAAGNSAPGFSDTGDAGTVAYDYLAKVWICKQGGGTDCSSVSDFRPALVIAYSYKSDGSVNKGYLLQDPVARDNGKSDQAGAFEITYNSGNSASLKKFKARVLRENSDKLRVDSSRSSSSVLSAQVVRVEATAARRLSCSIDLLNDEVGASYQANLALTDATTTPPTYQCLKRSRDDSDGDWSYSPDLMGSCSVDSYPESVQSISSGYTAAEILGKDASGNWFISSTKVMDANPSTL